MRMGGGGGRGIYTILVVEFFDRSQISSLQFYAAILNFRWRILLLDFKQVTTTSNPLLTIHERSYNHLTMQLSSKISLKCNQQDATFARYIYFHKLLYIFQAVTPPIIRSTKV
jgi:hypothetical protein